MTYKKIYVIGIGGIGNSALAQLFKHQGAEVLGSDRSESPTTRMLQAAGIPVYIGHHASQVPEDADMVVYTDAIVEGSEGYVERIQARELGIPELSYFEALGKVAAGKKVIAVSGTHGKTTTTAMIAKILVDAGEDPTVVVGSITADFHSNFRAGSSELFVVEADEYRRHFLQFNPHVLVITNIEYDHTDYYKDLDDFVHAFAQVAKQVESGGDIIANLSSENVQAALRGVEVNTIDYTKESVGALKIPGEHNVENAQAAKAAVHAILPHVKNSVINEALASFRGTWRRFEYKGLLPHGALLYDDYAHHPTAIEKTIRAARESFTDKRIVICFHPHLYSRTRDLFDDFARALSSADQVYILPVYAAREAYDPSVSNIALAAAVGELGTPAQPVASMEDLAQLLREQTKESVVFTMGAGDIYKAGEQALLG